MRTETYVNVSRTVVKQACEKIIAHVKAHREEEKRKRPLFYRIFGYYWGEGDYELARCLLSGARLSTDDTMSILLEDVLCIEGWMKL